MSRGRSPKRELVANRDFFLEVTKVPLSDFLTAIDPDPGYLEWHAAVRRIPFIYTPPDGPNFPHTAAVDYAPDVFEFIPVPPFIDYPEEPATWVPH